MAATLDRDGDVAELVLNAPPLNLFSEQMLVELDAAITELERAPARAMLFRAEGKVFSAGADVQIFEGHDGESIRFLTRRLLHLTARIEALPFPTVAVVHALCLTAGFEFSLACDMLWSAEEADFGLVEAVIGVTPLAGGTQRLVERAGSARAREFVMTGGRYGARELFEWGVVNRVIDKAELLPRSREFAWRLAAGPTRAHAATKRIAMAAREGVAEADRRTPELGGPTFDTADFRNALANFRADGPGRATFTGA